MSRFLVLFLLLACLGSPARSADAMTPNESIERFVANEAGAAVIPLGAGARVEVELGRLDPRLRLAACSNIEPFMPPGIRLWGRTHIGLRCADSGAQAARWQVFLPVTVRVFGPALVATRPIAAGQSFAADDLSMIEVEWTREAQGVLTDTAQLDGRVTSRPIATGQPIPLAALRAPQAVAAGDQVRIVGRGIGFSVAAQAVALNTALDGQSVRVRLDSGRILTGTARTGRWVEVSF
jgi:flagella basal body P-ring formation protein FlgA